MELRHLRYFVAVAREGGFVKAAEALHISQPPLSRQVRELEREVGTRLLERSGSGTVPTLAGEYFLAESERILDDVAAMSRSARSIGEAKDGDLRIGCVSFILETELLPFLGRFREEWPEARLEILSMSTEAQARALQSGAIDVGFARSWIDDETLVFEALREERLVLIYPSALHEGEDLGACMERLRDQPLIAMSVAEAPGLRRRFDEICGDFGFKPDVRWECNDSSVIVKLVASGLGWSIVPSFMVPAGGEAGIASLALPHTLTFGLCRRRAPLSPTGEALCALARQHFALKVPLA